MNAATQRNATQSTGIPCPPVTCRKSRTVSTNLRAIVNIIVIIVVELVAVVAAVVVGSSSSSGRYSGCCCW